MGKTPLLKPRVTLQEFKNGEEAIFFRCPGCGLNHAICVKAPAVPVEEKGTPKYEWEWNRDLVAPSVRPTFWLREYGGNGKLKTICHFFIKKGNIEFLANCAHPLANQTIPLPEVP